jgi:hypothetical protein
MPILPDPVKTQEEIAKEQAIEINQLAERLMDQSVRLTAVMFDKFWNNPAVTPAEMSAAYGTNAYALFVKLATFQAMLQAIDPSYVAVVVPEKWEYVINQDGTVTITEKVVPPPEPEPEPGPLNPEG